MKKTKTTSVVLLNMEPDLWGRRRRQRGKGEEGRDRGEEGGDGGERGKKEETMGGRQ